MDRNEAKNLLKGKLLEYLEKQKHELQPGKNGPCPVCGGDEGSKRASILPDGLAVHCFGGQCHGITYDIFDLIGHDYGIEGFAAQLEKGAELFGMVLDSQNGRPSQKTLPQLIEQQTSPPKNLVIQNRKPARDFSEYYIECQKNPEPAYEYLMKERMISREVCDKYKVGFDPQHYCAALSDPKKSIFNYVPSVIIPQGPNYYVSRSIKDKYFNNPSGGTITIDMSALDQPEPVFIVEGIIDAMSIETVGGNVVALHSTSNINLFMKLLPSVENKPPLILVMDKDEPGKKAQAELATRLREKGILFTEVELYGIYKDANEVLQFSPIMLKNAVEKAIAETKIAVEEYKSEIEAQDRAKTEKAEAEKALKREKYLLSSSEYHLPTLLYEIRDSNKLPPCPLGFPLLDNELEGGIYPGELAILGALPSLGKTSLITQCAANAAKNGRDVLFFSLEMTKSEIETKIISSLSYQEAGEGREYLAKSTRGISRSEMYTNYGAPEMDLIARSLGRFNEYAAHLYIVEIDYINDDAIGPYHIKSGVQKHIELTGKRPFVIIDYLQKLAPIDPRQPDKANIDAALRILKGICVGCQVPMLAISSINRSNYNTPISMAAFKETGNIEYDSDIMFGLQAAGTGTADFDIDKAKKQNPRKVELTILKRRSSPTGSVFSFDYWPKFNFFHETGKKEDAAALASTKSTSREPNAQKNCSSSSNSNKYSRRPGL